MNGLLILILLATVLFSVYKKFLKTWGELFSDDEGYPVNIQPIKLKNDSPYK